ncbi:hypothetical protein BK809_0004517 [Diplodia seriata]|uniref:SRP9 domain-containing protein n=1 Tax=Diplodia seriata TaxID=420778 RepID=A0A1S8B6W8_9PEZI|nr:hypothetical protein BK809_0004517 [Diplodia seriata]
MPYFTTSAEWFEQSRLLLEARPTTARIVTKYSIIKRKTTKDGKRQVATSDSAHADATQLKPPAPGAPAQAPAPTQAALTLKTYDPVSGVCLKYQTTKAAEVGRLIASLERLARAMAALPSVQEGMCFYVSARGVGLWEGDGGGLLAGGICLGAGWRAYMLAIWRMDEVLTW